MLLAQGFMTARLVLVGGLYDVVGMDAGQREVGIVVQLRYRRSH